MKTIAGDERGILTDHDESVSRRAHRVESEGYPMARGMRIGGKIPDGEEAGWWIVRKGGSAS